MITAFGATTYLGLRSLDRRKGAVLAFSVVPLVLFPLVVLAGDGNVVGDAVQARYFLPFLPVLLAALLHTPAGAAPLRFRRPQLVVIGVAVALAHSVALHTNLRRYVWGVAEDGFNLDAEREWWWAAGPTPMAVWLVGTIAASAAIACAVGVIDRGNRVAQQAEPMSVPDADRSAVTPRRHGADDPDMAHSSG
jgi:hypothetical protein